MEEIKIKKQLLVLVFIIFFSLSMASDISVQLSEKAINSFAAAISPLEFRKEIKVLDQKTMAQYSINDMVVDLKKDQIYVKGNLNLNLNGSTLDAVINGKLEPVLDDKTGILSLKLAKVNIVGLEFLKLDKVIKKDFSIPLKITDLKPIKIKKSEGQYQEIYPKITNENIIVADKLITIRGDISFKKGETVIKTEVR
ncbi:MULTISPECIES: hypothetical protein [Psychrilyobacter]|uniref:DUF2993 domain-containing protein n=1 Tax=Psychrilyobacter piezotolerans TaxID=2293438 RepID=A0ABX9KKB9_9FUSO|nr:MULTISPECIES: hypothetical protein [Psychrilyobacter]MCS5422485.1 hypothetical protein [Psychrilyobacter sp. S5]NDI76871.1 hypothetical protein [Psychrilyobacter piezotolerans]RDE65150.1 hypothetical protein DV867_02845 [Psychrilyobacter sp. S5]REI42720.1 hypothetical protein DYH56_02845 [Psychrilyobacter piezotolerans]